MHYFWYILSVLIIILLLVLITAYICFYQAFYVSKRRKDADKQFSIPPGEIYEPFRDTMVAWMEETKALPSKTVSIISFDGLTLYGKYYEYAPNAPIELMMHGYRGNSERDLCGGVQRAFALGRNALVVDQRASGNSEGKVISFGINESRDCLSWVDFIISNFSKEVKIILTGISMGAATVIIAAGQQLPKNVVGVLADCGYSTARDIIKKEIRAMKLPAGLLYPFVKLGAKIYGRFDLEETSPLEAIRQCRMPVIFIHGEDDAYVPCEMSKLNFEACKTTKKLVTVPKAGHGLSYPVNREAYLSALKEFFAEI